MIRSRLKRYSVALLAVVVAFLLTQLIGWLIQPHLYPLFLAAVMVSSWYGGMEPGLFAIALSALLCAYFFIPPLYSLAVSQDRISGLIQFVLVALLISCLNAVLRSTQRRAEINAQEAQRNYQGLLQSQEIIHQSEERYRLLVEGVRGYAIFMLDTNGYITSWNVGAKRILDYQDAEIIGQNFSRIFTPEAIEQGIPEQALSQAATEGMSRDNRWHVRKDGTRFWAHGVVTPLRGEDGKLRGFAKILQDLTERKLVEEEREQLLAREQAARAVSEAALCAAESANRSKDEFLAIVSHELRTPMTAIIGWAGMLQTGMLEEDRAALAIETIERNANLQMQLIEDLLDISRIIQGHISLNCRFVDLAEVITEAIEIVQPTADTKGISLEFQIESLLAAGAACELHQSRDNRENYELQITNYELLGDPDRLQQVVLNLLSNAVKFTPEGGQVEVRLSIVNSSLFMVDGDKQLTISKYAQIQVVDTGKGISADFLPYVFDRFRQADSTSARSNKGLGLGLAIARHLVELHGGTIQVESLGIGQGATFTVKLPFRAIRSPENALASSPNQVLPPMVGENAAPSDNSPNLDGLRVLVVDDDADVRQWITVLLQERKAEVIAVGSVGEALKALEQQKPDVLVSDIGLPNEDGYALIRKIRELEPEMGGRIPAVALTAYARVEDYSKALAEGFQLHVAKPIRTAQLVAVVASLAKMGGRL